MSLLIQQVLEIINQNTSNEPAVRQVAPAVPNLTTNRALSIQNLLAKQNYNQAPSQPTAFNSFPAAWCGGSVANLQQAQIDKNAANHYYNCQFIFANQNRSLPTLNKRAEQSDDESSLQSKRTNMR